MLVENLTVLAAYLADVQSRRGKDIKCELTPALSARISDAALVEALITGLPMVQGIQDRIVRSRGRGVVLTAKVQYRQGVRMLDAFRGGKWQLTNEEFFGLADACDVAMEALRQGGVEERFNFLYDLICRRIAYVHTSPGQKGYERLVGAASVLKDGQANCQGFADLLYLLCGICSIEAEYCCGRGERRLHVWNRVRLNGQWRDVDASKEARARMEERRIDISSTNFGPAHKNPYTSGRKCVILKSYEGN